MSGALWAVASGVGFGVFQVVNARAVRHLTQVYLATFVQLIVATTVFVALLVAAGDAGGLLRVPPAGLAWFAAAGVVHFLLGWTLLSQSQVRIGAARTSPLIATSPLFGLLLAVVLTGTLPGPVALVGIAVTVLGAYVVTDPGRSRRAALRDSGLGLATAASWALSAVLTVMGLRAFDAPLVGVTVGMAAAAVAYGAVLLALPATRVGGMDRESWTLKLLAGVLVAFATWWRYLGLAGATVGVVLALQLVTVPTVLAIVALRPHGERVTAKVWGGAAVVLLGVGLLIASPGRG